MKPQNNNQSVQIIGQDMLISEITKIFDIFTTSNCQIRPHFILIGPSGSGKTFTIATLCKEKGLGFIEVNAAQLTREGTAGNSLSKALSPLLQTSSKPTVVFVDEWDKLYISGNSNSECATETTTSVQNEFLKVLESDIATVFGDYGKYLNVNNRNTLYVFAGAFNGEENIGVDRLRELGVKTEFLGRVGLVYNTRQLSLDNLYEIIDHSKLLDNYLRLFTDVDRETVILELKAYIKETYEFNTLGARLINTLINKYFINGGLLHEDVEEVAFQKKLTLK